MSPRTGRPPLGDQARTEIRRVRFTAAEDARIVAAAERSEQTVADWCHDALLRAAKRAR